MFLCGMLHVLTPCSFLCHYGIRWSRLHASRAEYLKKGKYASIEATHHFVPIGIETTGVLGSEVNYFHQTRCPPQNESGDPYTYHFLLQ